MKQKLIVALAALACSAAFAQAPPNSQTNPTASGGAPAAKAEMKIDAKKAAGSTLGVPNPVAGMGAAAPTSQINPSASGGPSAARAEMKVDARKEASGPASMDTNGDGMISKKEWDRYHSGMWGKMKMKSKNGMVPWGDVDAMMKGGPN